MRVGVEPPEKLPSLSPPGQGHHSKVRAQASPNPAPSCACPLRPQPPGQPGPRSPRQQTESQHAPAPGGCEAQRRVCGAAWETVGCCAPPAGPGWLSLRTLRSEQPPELPPSPHGCHLPGLEPTEGEPPPKGSGAQQTGPAVLWWRPFCSERGPSEGQAAALLLGGRPEAGAGNPNDKGFSLAVGVAVLSGVWVAPHVLCPHNRCPEGLTPPARPSGHPVPDTRRGSLGGAQALV